VSASKRDRIRDALVVAIAAPPEERRRRIDEACSGDVDLQHAVERVLALHPDLLVPTASTTFTSSAPTLLPVPAATDPVTSSEMPHAWGSFVVLQHVGRGGFGAVYRAWDPVLEREVALKVLHDRALEQPLAEEWLREGQTMARVRHPSVVTVFSAQRTNSELGLIMEFVHGRTLASLVEEQGPLSAEEAAVIGMALCDALAAIHALNLVHRDIKASNVMRENGGRIVLMDFGASRDLRRKPDTGRVIGTPLYMAPEVLLGARSTAQSDIYSLGVLLYHLVTGSYPLEEQRWDDLRLAHVSGSRVPLEERRADLPVPFVIAVEAALSAEAADRPTTAVALRRELAKVVPSSSPLGLAGSMLGTTQATRPTHRWRAAAVFLLVCTVVGFLTSGAFNIALGRIDEFADERIWMYPYWGVRALVGPIVYLALAMLLIEAFGASIKLLGRVIPSVQHVSDRVSSRVRWQVRRWQLADPNTFVRTIAVAGLVALAVIAMSFRRVIVAYFSDIDTAPFDTLVAMGPTYSFNRFLYRRVVELLLLALVSALLAVWRRPARRAQLNARSLAEASAVIGLTLLLITVPWRTMYARDFPQFLFERARCSALGEANGRLLLHCPTLPVPRNRVVLRTDPGLRETGQMADLYDAYVP
jgi:serine/threonine protein kinase